MNIKILINKFLILLIYKIFNYKICYCAKDEEEISKGGRIRSGSIVL